MIMTLRQFSLKHPWPSYCGLRKYRERSLHMPTYFGFHDAFLKIGRRVLIDEEKFFQALSDFQLKQ